MGLFPVGRLSIRKAENLQSAIFLAKKHLNEVRVAFPAGLTMEGAQDVPPKHEEYSEELNGTLFKIKRDIYTLAEDSTTGEINLLDVVVTVDWEGAPKPLVLGTRINKSYIEMQNNAVYGVSPPNDMP